jgi:hypothetical protein
MVKCNESLLLGGGVAFFWVGRWPDTTDWFTIFGKGKIVVGFLCGWDRIRFQGSRGWLAGEYGFKHYLDLAHVRFKDFRDHAIETTERLRQDVEQREAKHEPKSLYTGERRH